MGPKQTTLVVIRHGRTDWNAQGRFLGRTDLPLDARGREQAEACARELSGFAAVYSSTLLRAKETAGYFGPVVTIPGLEELDQGDLDGLETQVALERYPSFFRAWAADPQNVPAPGATETLGDVQQRALGVLSSLAAAHRGQTIAVVSHQLVIASVRCHVHQTPLAQWRTHRLENLAFTRLLDREGELLAE